MVSFHRSVQKHCFLLARRRLCNRQMSSTCIDASHGQVCLQDACRSKGHRKAKSRQRVSVANYPNMS